MHTATAMAAFLFALSIVADLSAAQVQFSETHDKANVVASTSSVRDADYTDHPAYANSDRKDFDNEWHGKPAPADYKGPIPVVWNETTSQLHFNTKRAVPGVYICEKQNWQGRCYWTPAVDYECHMFQDMIGRGSFGIDRDIQCKVWDFENCDGLYSSTGKLTYPGVSGDISARLNKYMGSEVGAESWKCRTCIGCTEQTAPNWSGEEITFDSKEDPTWIDHPHDKVI